jgi:putative membrane protein
MHAVLVAASLAAALSSAPAFAQLGNPAGMKPATPEVAPGKPRPDEPDTQDRLFVQLLAAGGMAEVDAAQLARGRARSDGVRDFAQRMTHDHGAANARLAALARDAGIPLPAATDPDHVAMRRELESTAADRFDALYLHGQLVDHQKTAHLLEWEIGSGQDAALQRFAADTLPTVLEHLQAVQQLLSASSGAPPQGLGMLASTH